MAARARMTQLRFAQDRAYIEATLRTKIQGEAWSDAQVAKLLGVGHATITCWRNRLEIPPAAKFVRRFEAKYGPGALATFQALYAAGETLQTIGEYFGFTKDYARRVAQKWLMGPKGGTMR